MLVYGRTAPRIAEPKSLFTIFIALRKAGSRRRAIGIVNRLRAKVALAIT